MAGGKRFIAKMLVWLKAEDWKDGDFHDILQLLATIVQIIIIIALVLSVLILLVVLFRSLLFKQKVTVTSLASLGSLHYFSVVDYTIVYPTSEDEDMNCERTKMSRSGYPDRLSAIYQTL